MNWLYIDLQMVGELTCANLSPICDTWTLWPQKDYRCSFRSHYPRSSNDAVFLVPTSTSPWIKDTHGLGCVGRSLCRNSALKWGQQGWCADVDWAWTWHTYQPRTCDNELMSVYQNVMCVMLKRRVEHRNSSMAFTSFLFSKHIVTFQKKWENFCPFWGQIYCLRLWSPTHSNSSQMIPQGTSPFRST